MSATKYDVRIEEILGKKLTEQGKADEVWEALDKGGYLVEPGEPLHIELANRAVERETELADGVTLEWNNDTCVGIVLRDGLS